MEKAKQAVSSFMSHDGKHKTTVDETVRQATTDEHILPQRHENVTTAVDKEIHQDHHHTTVQPIKHKETLPEQHIHNMVPVEHKTFDHTNEQETRAHLDRDASKYKDSSVTHETTHSTSAAPVVTGERVHHHVHEHIQPVIQKETIAPQVVHTTVPVHETHRSAAIHHGTSTLPVKTLDQVTGKGGMLHHDHEGTRRIGEFEGCPEGASDTHQQSSSSRDTHNQSQGGVANSGIGGNTSTGSRHTDGNHMSSGMGGHNGNLHKTEHGNLGHDTRGSRNNTGQTTGGIPGTNTGTAGTRSGTTGTHAGATGTNTAKPSLMDKLNPFKDTDGDGKKGMMD